MHIQRQLPRWQVDKPARVRLKASGKFVDCLIENMNMKGMCVSLSQEIFQASFLSIVLALKADEELIMDIQIPWTRETGGRYFYGVEFGRMPERNKDSIDQYLQAHCAEQIKDNWWSGPSVNNI